MSTRKKRGRPKKVIEPLTAPIEATTLETIESIVRELPFNPSDMFACPIHKVTLIEWVCPTCSRKYEQFEGIPILTPPQLREGVSFDNYKYLDDPINPAWNAGAVTTVGFVNAQLNYEEVLKVRTFSGDRYRFFRDNASGVILDAGCNCGGVTNILKGEQVYGLDFLMIHLIRAKKECHEGIIWVNAGAEYLPFMDEYFDTVCLGEMMEHVPDPVRPVFEAIRVLKPGGTMLIVNQHRPVEFRGDQRKPVELRDEWVRNTINPCNPDMLKSFLDTLPIKYEMNIIAGGGGQDPNGIFVKGIKIE